MRLVIMVIFALSASGSSSLHYEKTKAGALHGKLIVQWIDHDTFIFAPDKEKPLTFVRNNNESITPERMGVVDKTAVAS